MDGCKQAVENFLKPIFEMASSFARVALDCICIRNPLCYGIF